VVVLERSGRVAVSVDGQLRGVLEPRGLGHRLRGCPPGSAGTYPGHGLSGPRPGPVRVGRCRRRGG
jgi:hypothetical protein